MKFKVEVEQMLKACNIAFNIYKSQYGENFLHIDALLHKIKISAQNQQMYVESFISTPVEVQGAAMVPAKVLIDVLKRTNQETTISFHIINNQLLLLSPDDKITKLPVTSASFVGPKDEFEEKEEMGGEIFQKMVKKALFFDDKKEADENDISSANLVIQNEMVKLVILNKHRIAIRKEPINGSQTMDLTISLTCLKKIAEIVKDYPLINLQKNEKFLKISTKDFNVFCRLLEKKVLDIEGKFKNCPHKGTVLINRRDLMESLERAILFSSQAPFTVKVQDGAISVASKSLKGEIQDRISSEIINGEEGDQIQYNPKYLLEVIKILEEEEVRIFYNSNLPNIIKADDLSYMYIILPIFKKES